MTDSELAGWPRSHELLPVLDLVLAESYRAITRGSVNGCILEEDGLLLHAGGHPSPLIINGAMRVGPGLSAAEVLRRADDFFTARSHGYGVTTRAHGDEDVDGAARKAGMELAIELPALVLDRSASDVTADVGPPVRPVVDDLGVRDYAAVLADAFEDQESDSVGLAASVLRDVHSLAGPHLAAFVAYVGGQPGAAAMVIVSHRVGFLQWVGTRPSVRRRGLARAVTLAAVSAGFARGARLAMLLTSPMGESLYRGLGFHPATSYRRWRPPSQPHTRRRDVREPG